MKIADVKVHVLTAPLETPFAFSMGWVKKRSAAIVEMTTKTGVVGWGESLCHGLQPPEVSAAIITHALAPIVLGQDVFDADVRFMLDANHADCVAHTRRILLALRPE